MTAFEMFVLRDDNEPIQAAAADRLAYAIGTNPEERRGIAENLRNTYKLHSGRVHHGKSIGDTETIERFLSSVWLFFRTAILQVAHFRSRSEFLDRLDRMKYGEP